jgi:hypothetical protein
MCLLLVLPFSRAFLQRPLTELTSQTRQAVCAISLSFLDIYAPSTLAKFSEKSHCETAGNSKSLVALAIDIESL